MVEQRTENPCVGSSTLPLGTFTQQNKTSDHIGRWFFVLNPTMCLIQGRPPFVDHRFTMAALAMKARLVLLVGFLVLAACSQTEVTLCYRPLLKPLL